MGRERFFVSTTAVQAARWRFWTVLEIERKHGWLDTVGDPIRLHILRPLSQVPEAAAPDLASWGQASGQTLRRHLDALVVLGVIEERPGASDGATPGRPAARFSLSPDLRDEVQAVFGTSL